MGGNWGDNTSHHLQSTECVPGTAWGRGKPPRHSYAVCSIGHIGENALVKCKDSPQSTPGTKAHLLKMDAIPKPYDKRRGSLGVCWLRPPVSLGPGKDLHSELLAPTLDSYDLRQWLSTEF